DIETDDTPSPAPGELDRVRAGPAAEVEHHLPGDRRPDSRAEQRFDLAAAAIGAAVAGRQSTGTAARVPQHVVPQVAADEAGVDHVWLSRRSRRSMMTSCSPMTTRSSSGPSSIPTGPAPVPSTTGTAGGEASASRVGRISVTIRSGSRVTAE